MKNPKIAVIGVGAVGGFYGAKLARAGSDVHFLLRGDYEYVVENGLRIFSPDGDFDLQPVNAHRTVETVGACDVVIIALKATANDILPGVLPPLLSDSTAILTLQNGLGGEEFLAAHFGAERVLGGRCFVCLNRVAPGTIRHIGHGAISVGEFGRPAVARTHAIGNLFQNSGVSCQVSDDIKDVLWRKLVWNIPFNGLAIAGGGIDVAQIIADAELLARTRVLMREVIAIARASGVFIEDDYVEFQIERTRPMGPYQPSSLLDWQAEREVEVEPIWGEPLRRAHALGVEAPQLSTLLATLRSLCRQ